MYFSNVGKPGSRLAARTSEAGAISLQAAGMMFVMIGVLESGERVEPTQFAETGLEVSKAFEEASQFYSSLAEHTLPTDEFLSQSEAELAAVSSRFLESGLMFSTRFLIQPSGMLRDLSNRLKALADLVSTLTVAPDRAALAPQIFQMMYHWQEAAIRARVLSVMLRKRPIIDEGGGWLNQ